MAEQGDASRVRNRRGFPGATAMVVADTAAARDHLSGLLSSATPPFAVTTSTPGRIPELGAAESPRIVVLWCAPEGAHEALQMIKRHLASAQLVLVLPDDARAAAFTTLHEQAAVVYVDRLEQSLAPTLQAVLAEQAPSPGRHLRGSNGALLSRLERQVLRLATLGLSNDEIARRLSVGTLVVRSHLNSGFVKLAAPPGAADGSRSRELEDGRWRRGRLADAGDRRGFGPWS